MSDPQFPLEVTVTDARDRLAARPDATVLLDVREAAELAICSVPAARHIPMGQIPAHLDQLPRDQDILVMCHHGGRSLRVTYFLRQHGFDRVANVAGGIDAWAEQIDPALARY